MGLAAIDMESHTASDPAVWSTPQCPVRIEYSLRTLDEIRLAVVDAFFSVPRGGAEIGGVFLGRHSGQKVSILDFRPLECEHAFGPSFSLSPRDHHRLAELLASIYEESGGLTPVGWYHSHTRSEIFLSDADLEIHKQYFPESWQVALVLKPHAFQPMRAGFFVSEKDGSIFTQSSHREFVLDPLGMPAPSAEPAPAAPAETFEAEAVQPALDFPELEPETPEPEEIHTPDIPHAEYVPPFARVEEPAPERPRGWLGIVIAVGAGLLLGGAAYETRQFWMNPLLAQFRSDSSPAGEAPNAGAPYMGLRCMDTDGQLWIFWDHSSAQIKSAAGGTLIIHDGPQTRTVDLDSAHLQAGSFTYGRETEKVDLTLTVTGPKGEKLREVTTYLGKLPVRLTPVDEAAAVRDEVAKKAQKQSQRPPNKKKPKRSDSQDNDQ
jgi:proteasome lid subunit RPN8/RPN11